MTSVVWKRREIFSKLNIPDDFPVILRLDGWRFHRIAHELRLKKPFDSEFIRKVVKSARKPMEIFPIELAFVFSDEISYLLLPPLPWNGRLEKLDSVIPSLVSSSLSLLLGTETAFDSRVIVVHSTDEVLDYLSWRQMEAWRNHVNAYAQIAAERDGVDITGMRSEELHDLVFKRLGINLAKTPCWQRRGVLIYWKEYEKEGFDPVSCKKVKVKRRRLEENWEVPTFSSPHGRELLHGLIRFTHPGTSP